MINEIIASTKLGPLSLFGKLIDTDNKRKPTTSDNIQNFAKKTTLSEGRRAP